MAFYDTKICNIIIIEISDEFYITFCVINNKSLLVQAYQTYLGVVISLCHAIV